jgi:hypothetical protein
MSTAGPRSSAGRRCCGVGSVRPNSGARWSQSHWRCSVRCLSLTQRVDGTALRGLNVPRFIPVGAARRRPLEGGGVAVMLHVHWLGGSTPG